MKCRSFAALFLVLFTLSSPAQADLRTTLARCNLFLTEKMSSLGTRIVLANKTVRESLEEKLGERTIDNLIRGERLDLSNLFLTDEEALFLVEHLKNQNTTAVTHLNLNFNPQLTRISVDKLFRMFPNVTHLYLENVTATAHKLHVIGEFMPQLTTLRLSLLDGEDVYALDKMKNLSFLDLSTVMIRASTRWIDRNDAIMYPSVSLSAINEIIRNNRGRTLSLILPRLSVANDEGIRANALRHSVKLLSVPAAYKAQFIDAVQVIEKKGIRMIVDGKEVLLYLPAFILPMPLGYSPNEIDLAEHVDAFIRSLAREKVEAYMTGSFHFSKEIVYGDVMFRRVINGEPKLFSLKNMLEHLRFGVEAKTSWKTHLLKEKTDFGPALNMHLLLLSRGYYNPIGPIALP